MFEGTNGQILKPFWRSPNSEAESSALGVVKFGSKLALSAAPGKLPMLTLPMISGKKDEFSEVWISRSTANSEHGLRNGVAFGSDGKYLLCLAIISPSDRYDGVTEDIYDEIFKTCADLGYRECRTGQAVPPYQLRVVDSNGLPVAPTCEGSLEVKGPTITKGVHKGSEKPQRFRDSWYATGDAARVDCDGYFELLGRLEDVENILGIDVYPAEVEAALLEVEGISHAGVCSVSRPMEERRLLAFVVSENGQDLNREDILQELVTKLAPDEKRPSEVAFVRSLPYIAGGKLSRKELRLMAETQILSR